MATINLVAIFMPKKTDWIRHFSEAKRYSSRSEFAKSSPSAYGMLWRHGLLDRACSHMSISPVYSQRRWDSKSVLAEASKYGSRSEFKRACSGAYCYALSNGFLDQACAHMMVAGFWHPFELMAAAIKYSSFSDFRKSEPSAYSYAKKAGLTDIVASRLARRRFWTRDAVMIEAAAYGSRSSFRLLASGAYKHAVEHGYLDDACAHMQTGGKGFSADKPASLYVARLFSPLGVELFKAGITNRDPSARIAGLGVPDGWEVELLDVFSFDCGRDARIAEKRLHRKMSSYRYEGPSVLRNGNTELFTTSPLENMT